MLRPKRSAALRALDLIKRGYNVARVDAIGSQGLTPEEEDAINEDIEVPTETVFLRLLENEDTTDGCAKDNVTPKARFKSYEDEDVEPSMIKFAPCNVPGLHLPDSSTRLGAHQYTKAIDFFQLFITDDLLETIAENTNLYAWLNILDKPSYGRRDGAWEETSKEELKFLIALLIFDGFNGRKDIDRNWSQATLYSGGWARRFLSKNRFKALNGMLHLTRPGEEDETDKLAKVRPLINHMRSVYSRYFHPRQSVSIDERMVPSKGRSPILQYMPSKPHRYGYKLWCMCDVATGYTFDFTVYTGRDENRSAHGLGFDVVTTLMSPHLNRGYRVFCDSYFSSVALAKYLAANGTYMCGTVQPWRRGFPMVLKEKTWVKKAKRGDMRFAREDGVLLLQWFDKQVVNMISTVHSGNDHILLFRRGKNKEGRYAPEMVRVPTCIKAYNKNMGGVDLADQMLESYSCLAKVRRWWKTLFFHFVDMSVLNSYILFKLWSEAHPEIAGLRRHAGYSHLSFREELVRQLARIHDDEPIPVYLPGLKRRKSIICTGPHDPISTKIRRNCQVCYLRYGKQRKSYIKCSDEQCQVHLCLNGKRNCFPIWHSSSFDMFRRARKS